MNRGSYAAVAFVVGLVTLFVAAGICAGTEVPEVIQLEDKAYKKHKYAIVKFSHKKHQEDYVKKYPEFYNSPCGECHHDENNKPLVNLKVGDDVKRCLECHKKADYVKGKKAKGLSKEQKREYQANAMHDNCRVCHRKYNKKNKLKSKSPGYAPATCKKCHKK